MVSTLLSLALAALSSTVAAKEVPSNLRAWYDSHMNSTAEHLAGPFEAYYDSGERTTSYVSSDGLLYLKNDNGGYADMDIDCDGSDPSSGGCFNDPTGQSQTAFKDTVAGYGAGINDLDAHIHNYVVLGNVEGDITFNPRDAGIRPLSVVAVVCGDKLHYGIWGDVNGGTVVGEASLSIGEACYGDAVNGNMGHTGKDVLFLAFPGDDAVPGADGANWAASSKEEFEASIESLGDRLVAQL